MVKAYLEPHEIVVLETAASNMRDRLLIRLPFRLGCRIGEALAITCEDLDLVNGTVRILHLKTRFNCLCPNCNARLSRKHIFCPKCGQKVDEAVTQAKEHRRMRLLPIDGETLHFLTEYVSRGGPVERDGKRLLFGINRHRGWQVVSECAEKAGLPKLLNPETGRVHNVSPHRLREAFAVLAVKANDSGDGIRMLQEHLGHASFNTTARYRKVSGQEHRDWYQKLWGNQSATGHRPEGQSDA